MQADRRGGTVRVSLDGQARRVSVTLTADGEALLVVVSVRNGQLVTQHMTLEKDEVDALRLALSL